MHPKKLSVEFRLFALRKFSLRLSDDLHTASRQVREARKRCEQPCTELLDRLEFIGGTLVAAGRALVILGDEIDASMTVLQKAALISASRFGESIPEETKFVEMIGAGFEVPKDRRGCAQCGPLFIVFAAAPGAMLRGKHEREHQELVAARVKAAGPLNMPSPSAVQ